MGKPKKKPAAKATPKPNVLPSAALPRAHLVETGSRWNGGELTGLWESLKPKVAAHAGEFAALGFTAAWSSGMDALATRIHASVEKKTELLTDAAPTASALNDVIGRCKDWRRAAATRLAISPKLASRAPKIQTGSSPRVLVKSMRAILPLVGSADCASPDRAAMKAQGQKLLAELTVASKKHEGATGKLSPALRDRNADEGVFYEELKRLARGARHVAPEEGHLFAPMTHVRARLPSRAKKSKLDGAGSSATAVASSGAATASSAPATASSTPADS